ncbi:tripartite tricarboxylate transporter permease [Brevibacterium sp. SMBL_HHYL_HB1]|uniref:tripartite tricarboxylate transporter permease n=1 Tax=Brevibacterium sp. SMBL_HHYL_HB1 TaxID=2777556 RepID=UPI001BAB26B8|nr:tripartite tricarboxylate transporter permease [Brevibacterium sp. SMBL_HHYL_HB1]QUL78815.1 tripartite tricarboxylate transporter permease [Brevibacterium sp. SMBL_HHYL_HB1]
MDLILQSFESIANVQTLLILLAGVVAGIVIGSIPGFTITMGVALTLPFSFGMEPLNGIALMIGVMVGGSSGGLLPAILLGIPGTPSAMATTFDGYPMTRKGMAGKALSVGLVASTIGSLISGVILIFVAPVLAEFATDFGPWELFSLMFFGLTAIASVGGGSLVKGLIGGVLGVAFSMVGIDLLTGTQRFTFGFVELQGGFNFLPVLIGLFAFSQLLSDVKNPLSAEEAGNKNVAYPLIKGIMTVVRKPIAIIRASLVGTFVGILPGAGGSIANVMSYDIAKKTSRNPEKFGTGVPEGVVASEAANNSSVGGALVPAMAFGIPGDATTAMVLGALLIHGIQPGPLFLTSEPVLAYGIFIAFFIAAIFMLLVQSYGIRLFLLVNRIPQHHLVPGILVLCAVGSFAVSNRIFDVGVLLLFGIIGYWMKKNDFSLAAFILGIILGPMIETNLRQAVTISSDLSLFITRPISGVLIVLSIISLAYGIFMAVRSAKTPSHTTVPADAQE